MRIPPSLTLIASLGCATDNDAGSVFTDGVADEAETSASDEVGETNEATGDGDSGDGDGDSGDGDGSTDGGVKFDVGPVDAGDRPRQCGCGTDEWSYIWIANAQQSTVSKVNTVTGDEEGRYRTRMDSGGNPSRTSVSLGGRSVAVANRYGGVIKVWAREQFCTDANNDGDIDTSTGAGDIRGWGEDECVGWYTDFPTYTTQRPVAWGGVIDPITCDDQVLWTAGCGGGFTEGFGGQGPVFAHRLDGATGEVLDTIQVDGFTCSGFGAYGGAVDAEGNFWIGHNGTGGKLGRIDGETLGVTVYDYPGNGFAGYGITVDTKGRPWVSSYGGDLGAARFDPETETWATVSGFASQGGIQQAEDKRIWVTTVAGFNATLNQNGLIWIDDETVTAGDSVAVAGGTVKGLSHDIDGYVWAVTGTAYKYDAATLQVVDTYAGLAGPYTYSDMTGWGLQNTICNPEG